MLVQARVDFRKPDHKELTKQGYTLVDMHVHSKYSDGINKISTILRKVKKLGIGIAITDHNEIKGCLEAINLGDTYVIPGIETNSDEGIHTLFYFYSKKDLEEFYYTTIYNKRRRNPYSFLKIGLADLIDRAKAYNCIISAAHPFSIAWTGMCKYAHRNYVDDALLERIDAIEVMTGSNLRKANLKAVEFAEKINKGITGGSDAHTLHEIGKVVTYAKERINNRDFLESILQHKSFVMGKESQILHRAATHSVKIRAPLRDPITPLVKGIKYMTRREYKIRKIISPIREEISLGYTKKKEQIKRFFRKKT